jgi:enamine deaminase RidA (YjgF/YER057c/UK114 family)
MTDASSAQRPVTANFINPETMHHPAGYTHVVEVTAGRPVYIAGQVALDPTGAVGVMGVYGIGNRLQPGDGVQEAVRDVVHSRPFHHHADPAASMDGSLPRQSGR